MQHFVCIDGCGGESSNPKVCETEGCKREGEPLIPCTCESGLHEGAKEKGDTEQE